MRLRQEPDGSLAPLPPELDAQLRRRLFQPPEVAAARRPASPGPRRWVMTFGVPSVTIVAVSLSPL